MIINKIVLTILFSLQAFVIGGLGGGGTFNVKSFGAKGDGKTDDSKALEAAWKEVCAASGAPILWIPKGSYLICQVKFTGPCKGATSITFQLEGTLLATPSLSQFTSTDWVMFGWMDGLTLTGGGTFDGQGASSWPQNKCPTGQNCKVLPTGNNRDIFCTMVKTEWEINTDTLIDVYQNIKFHALTNTHVKNINSLNSKFFHIGIMNCQNFDARGLKITAPENSPNTDGIHVERSTGVTIADSHIGTGDDCISIGHGTKYVTVTGVFCGPGHGISVGSLGKYANEENVHSVIVKNCTLTKTMNGVRIKTWENSPASTVASNVTFEDIVMNDVGNPIIVDQTYCPFASCSGQAVSKVKLQDITFRNIRGTSSSPVPVTLKCGMPCSNVIIENVHLEHPAGTSPSVCTNVRAKFVQTTVPAPCK